MRRLLASEAGRGRDGTGVGQAGGGNRGERAGGRVAAAFAAAGFATPEVFAVTPSDGARRLA